MQTVVSPLSAQGLYHTAPQSLLKSYKIKSKNLTFSLTRGPGAGSATITNGLEEQIEMKVVNEAHVKMAKIREREGCGESRRAEQERKKISG